VIGRAGQPVAVTSFFQLQLRFQAADVAYWMSGVLKDRAGDTHHMQKQANVIRILTAAVIVAVSISAQGTGNSDITAAANGIREQHSSSPDPGNRCRAA